MEELEGILLEEGKFYDNYEDDDTSSWLFCVAWIVNSLFLFPLNVLVTSCLDMRWMALEERMQHEKQHQP